MTLATPGASGTPRALDLAGQVTGYGVTSLGVRQQPGFEQIGVRRGYHHAPDGREDAIVLKLALRQP